MMRKAGLCALLACCLLFSACAVPEGMKLKGVNSDAIFNKNKADSESVTPTPAPTERPDGCEGAALDFLEALRDGKRNELRLFSEEVPGYTGETTHPLFSAAYSSLTWKLQGYKEGKSGYALTVELTVRDMREVLQQLTAQMEERQEPDCDRYTLAEQLLQDILAESEVKTLSRRVTMTLSKATGTWRLLSSEELFNALSGYLLSALKEYDLPELPLADAAMADSDYTVSQRLLNNGLCSVSLLGTYPNAPDGYTVALECVNHSGAERVFSARNMLINGFVIDPEWYMTVPSGQTLTGSIVIPRGELLRCGIESVRNISFDLALFTTHAWPVYPELSLPCSVYPHGRDKSASPTVEREGEQRLLDTPSALFSVLDIVDEGCWGCTLLLSIDNRSQEALWFSVGELSVDGTDYDPGWSQLLPVGCKAVEELRIPAGLLLGNGGEGADSLSFLVVVSDLVNIDKKDVGVNESGRYTIAVSN